MYQKRSYKEKKEKAICPVCGKTFIKKVHNQVYCSPECKDIAKRQRERKYRELEWWQR